jgi:ergothioneine biosynthesis protein EgtB
MTSLISGPNTMIDDFKRVRATTEALAAPLSAEDQTVQSMPDTSPTKWHLAHVTWFFEEFLLRPFWPNYQVVDDSYGYIFNSYYEGVGPRHPRAARGLITRPGVDEIAEFRARVDETMSRLLADLPTSLCSTVELGLHHEQQHQELLLMDIKHLFASNPSRPAYSPSHRSPGVARSLEWIPLAGGIVDIGAPSRSQFAFDNEAPRHRVWLDPYLIANRLVNAGEWMTFMEDGGYERPSMWLSDGWAWVQSEARRAPLYWQPGPKPSSWQIATLTGLRTVDASEPVVHVSYYEADAFAHWANSRLPTEAEWEHAASLIAPVEPVDAYALHPAASNDGGWFGQVWQWTSSAHLPYPGFVPASGVIGEYNGKFMCNQHVARGSACITPRGHTRLGYRNFFPPAAQWAFTGLRLAC